MPFNKRLKIKLIFSNNLFLFFLFLKYESISEEWTKYIYNPVLGNNKTGTVFDPFVIKYNNIYKMYVSWRTTGAIALSTSKDGIKWSELKIILNKGNRQSWESIVYRSTKR